MKKTHRLLISMIVLCLISVGMLTPKVSYGYSLPMLNKTYVNLETGKSIKLKVKYSKLKFKWSSSNKKIATVNSKGKVTAKKVGSCKIYAKNTKKRIKLACSVKVSYNKDELVSNVTVNFKNSSDGKLLAFIKNNNNCTVYGDIKVAFFDYDSYLIDDDTAYIMIAAKQEICQILSYPHDGEYNTVETATHTYNLDIDYTSDKNYAEDISTEYNYSPSGIAITATNNSSETLSSIYYTCVSYDNDGNAICADWGYFECESPGTKDYETISYRHDANYDDIIPAYSEIYVKYAY